VRVLNAANVHIYQNTFVNTVASFERTERSAVGDHFGWHPSTGPDVHERDGNIFVGNLLVADEAFRKPLLRVEQTRGLCGKLTNSQLAKLDGNLYVRSGSRGEEPLLVWSPVAGANCVTELKSLDVLRSLHPEYESSGREFPGYYGSVLKGPEIKNYRLRAGLKVTTGLALPDEVRALLGWPKQQSYAPGAYPAAE
jgi:hypothetical protein